MKALALVTLVCLLVPTAVSSMVAVDPVWQTEDLDAFTVDCGPAKAAP